MCVQVMQDYIDKIEYKKRDGTLLTDADLEEILTKQNGHKRHRPVEFAVVAIMPENITSCM